MYMYVNVNVYVYVYVNVYVNVNGFQGHNNITHIYIYTHIERDDMIWYDMIWYNMTQDNTM